MVVLAIDKGTATRTKLKVATRIRPTRLKTGVGLLIATKLYASQQ
jgi:hypothetical protein